MSLLSSALKRAQGYPIIDDRPDGGLEIKDRVYSDNTDYVLFKNLLPTPGFPMTDIEPTALLLNRTIRAQDQTDYYWYADLTYGTPGKTQWAWENAEFHDRIENKTTENGGLAYLQKWKSHLAGKDTSASAPSWWGTAINMEDVTTTVADDWRWVSDPAEAPPDPTTGKRWAIKYQRTKPGQDTYISGMLGLRATMRYPSFDAQSGAVRPPIVLSTEYPVGKRVDLSPFAPYSDWVRWEAVYWLIADVQIQPDGFYWTRTIRFRFNPNGWDSEVYGLYGEPPIVT
jgi:hypothetical protein